MALSVEIPPDMMGGDVDEGYGPVADVFRSNLANGGEVGAAVAVYRDGVKVVDLWGGYSSALAKAPWRADTMVNMFSTTKGISALTTAAAVSRGLFSYDAKVADYWPEFASDGKDDITVRQLLAHQAGLCVLKPAPTLADVGDPTQLSAILAAQTPAWTPGTRHGYHAITLGWYQSELIRRTDPAGRTLGRFFAEEIAIPLELDFHIGLPAAVNRDRIAYLHMRRRAEALRYLNQIPAGMLAASFNPFGLTNRSAAIPRDVDPWRGDYNDDRVRTVEMPSSNGIGTARSVARLYGAAAIGGADLGLNSETFNELVAAPIAPSGGVRDKVFNVDVNYALGFGRPVPHACFGSSDKAFGTPGFGGSIGLADPDTGVGFSYVMNRPGFRPWSDPRELALRQALFGNILKARPQT